jgi:hypothetical protein
VANLPGRDGRKRGGRGRQGTLATVAILPWALGNSQNTLFVLAWRCLTADANGLNCRSSPRSHNSSPVSMAATATPNCMRSLSRLSIAVCSFPNWLPQGRSLVVRPWGQTIFKNVGHQTGDTASRAPRRCCLAPAKPDSARFILVTYLIGIKPGQGALEIPDCLTR